MSTVQVVVDDGELHCCGGPVGLGDRVSWSLLVTATGVPEPVERWWTVTELPVPGPGWSARAVVADDLRATWVDRAHLPSGGRHRLRSHLVATWHGGQLDGELPRIPARVVSIQVLSQQFDLAEVDGSPGHVPRGEAASLRDVDTMLPLDDGPADDGAPSYVTESGWLVDLQLDR